MIVRRRVRIHGRVQGVGFRYFTVGVARGMEVAGTVANRADGTVEAVVEGDEKTVRAFIDRLREGPPASRVERIEIEDEPPRRDMDGFEIIHIG
jgi:acylphosphatase